MTAPFEIPNTTFRYDESRKAYYYGRDGFEHGFTQEVLDTVLAGGYEPPSATTLDELRDHVENRLTAAIRRHGSN